MPTPPEAQARAARTYNATADSHDHPANAFWERFGRGTVARLRLAPGAQVLDVCCGSGASALPAAEAVGPTGSVLGVDLAENLLELARAKASSRGLTNITFRTGDMLDLGLPDAAFDAVVCVFGIFFVPDMAAAVRELWRRVRPGGQLAITTWGPRFLEPGNTNFWDTVRKIKPDLYKNFNPWDRITDPASVRALLAEGGVSAPDVVAEAATQALHPPEDWWYMVRGTGYRGTLEQLTLAEREQVREVNVATIRRDGISAVETNVVYAVARKES